MRRKEEKSKQGQTNNKAKQHSTPKAVTLNELPQVQYIMHDTSLVANGFERVSQLLIRVQWEVRTVITVSSQVLN